MAETEARANEVLEFWFADVLESPESVAVRSKVWFAANPEFDAEIRRRFDRLPEQGLAGELDAWLETPRGTLALVIALDQFPRNLYRGTARAFAFDSAARAAASLLVSRGLDETLHPVESVFLYLPFEHSEALQDQQTSLELYRALEERAPEALREEFERYTAYARRHYDVIARFARFPHRNELLGRPSTDEEVRYLADGGDRF